MHHLQAPSASMLFQSNLCILGTELQKSFLQAFRRGCLSCQKDRFSSGLPFRRPKASAFYAAPTCAGHPGLLFWGRCCEYQDTNLLLLADRLLYQRGLI